jgi:hypothetical protein
VDTSLFQFFGKFQENFLLIDVNMFVDCRLRRLCGDLPQILTRIAPLITSIDSIASSEMDLFKMIYKTNNTNRGNSHESQLLMKEMLEKTRILSTDW